MNWTKKVLFLTCLLLFSNSCQSPKKVDDTTYDRNRFSVTVLTKPGELDEPMAFTFPSTEEVLWVERKGGVKSLNLSSQEVKQIGFVPVNTVYTNKEGRSRAAEEGLMGIIADPSFAQNQWIYMLYADPEEPKHVLARWDYREDTLVASSKVIVLQYPVQREECCHTGGGMVFDKNGNLYLTTGNNTVNPPQGTSNLDERPGRELHDDQRTAGNSNDYRGKILRIHPEPDGGYSIPDGNLFSVGAANTLPEIYTMGHRNPWRISIDHQTGYIYWGEVGPDASEDTDQGPKGYDEFNQAKGPGFFGWPYFIGDNKPYADYDYATDSIYGYFDVENPINTSPNNTGIQELPRPEPAFFWYPYGRSEEFPQFGSAGRSATGGPVFRSADFPDNEHRFPNYYEGKWFITDFMRGWIFAITMDESGEYLSMEPFLTDQNFSSAIDMQFGPLGDLFVLEYGSAWFQGNENAQIKRIRYTRGNRSPVARIIANPSAGALPLSVELSGAESEDPDGDPIQVSWEIQSQNGFQKELSGIHQKLDLNEAGLYQVTLKVQDDQGLEDQTTLDLVAGNASPQVDIELLNGNQTFFFPGTSLEYQITVSDLEDGSLEDGSIPLSSVAINFDYVPAGFDPVEIAQNHVASDEWVSFSKGKALIEQGDCFSCHRMDVKSIGPSYQQIAETYQDDQKYAEVLAQRIVQGSVGIWGEHAMSAHPDLSEQEALLMVDYILGLDEAQPVNQEIPAQGNWRLTAPPQTEGQGGYLLRAAYRDAGNNGLPSLASEKIIALRNPVLLPEQYDEADGIQYLITPRKVFNIIKHQAHITFEQLDLTGIDQILIDAEVNTRNGATGAKIELRTDSVRGELIGVTEFIEAMDIDFRAELEKLRKAWEANGSKGPRPNFRTVRELFQKKYVIDVQGRNGMYDLVFVFNNPNVQEGQILLQLNSLEFIPAESIIQ